MSERPKGILMNAQDVVFKTKPTRANPLSDAVLLGQIDYKKTPTDYLLEQKISLYYGRLTGLQPDALSFINDESAKADMYIGNVDYRDVNSARTFIKEAGLSSGALKSMFLRKVGWDETADKGTTINELRKRHSRLDYYDNNEGDVLDLARIFRSVQFYLIQNERNGRLYSEEEARKLPNVHRIAKLPVAQIDKI